MNSLFVSKDSKLEREASTLIIRTGTTKVRVPVFNLEHVIIAGEAGLSTSILNLLGKNGIRISILDWYGNVTNTIEPKNQPKSGLVHLAQARAIENRSERLRIAQEIVTASMKNMRANLRYRSYRGSSKLAEVISEIDDVISRAARAETIESLMGLEGLSRAWYYQSWPHISPKLTFGSRKRRPPNNPINCLISWFNGLLYVATRHEIAKTHLDDCLSFLHSPTEARHSLALDLSEPFKPAIVDTVIFEIILRSTNIGNWFVQDDCVCRLTEIGRKESLEIWTRKIESNATNSERSFKKLIYADALSLERHLLEISKFRAWTRKV